MITGSVVSQAIVVVSSPLITRIYNPEAFGLFAVFVSTIAILGVVGCLRYELAIVLPADDAEAKAILNLCLILNITLASFTILLLYFLQAVPSFTRFTQVEALGRLIWFVPLCLIPTSIFQTFTFWFSRTKTFSVISTGKILQSFSIILVQIFFAFLFSPTATGLIVGTLAGQAMSTIYLLFYAKRIWIQGIKFSKINFPQIRKVALDYRRYPFFSMPGALLNSISSEFPIFIISFAYGLAVSGPYSLALRVLALPISLISSSIYQVLVSKFSELNRDDPQRLLTFVLHIFFILFAPAISIALLFQFIGVDLFEFVFGDQWTLSGEIAIIIIFSQAFKFSISPLAAILGLKQNVHLGFIWQLFYCGFSILFLTYISSFDHMLFFQYLAILDCVAYAIYFAFILFAARKARH